MVGFMKVELGRKFQLKLNLKKCVGTSIGENACPLVHPSVVRFDCVCPFVHSPPK